MNADHIDDQSQHCHRGGNNEPLTQALLCGRDGRCVSWHSNQDELIATFVVGTSHGTIGVGRAPKASHRTMVR